MTTTTTTKQAFARRYGPWALVTGAAQGLGAEFARQLGARGTNVVLVDRASERVAETAREVARDTGVETRAVVCDLAREGFLADIETVTRGLEVGLVVSCAALGLVGRFLDADVERGIEALSVNTRAPLVLAHAFGGAMRARGRGALLFVGSLSGLQGTALVANYAATKAYNVILAEGLWAELREEGIDVLAIAPAAIDTPGFRSSSPGEGGMRPMRPEDVVREALESLGGGPTVVPGTLPRWIAAALAVVPRRARVAMMARAMKRMYPRL